jgi:hypothetical protein
VSGGGGLDANDANANATAAAPDTQFVHQCQVEYLLDQPKERRLLK